MKSVERFCCFFSQPFLAVENFALIRSSNQNIWGEKITRCDVKVIQVINEGYKGMNTEIKMRDWKRKNNQDKN